MNDTRCLRGDGHKLTDSYRVGDDHIMKGLMLLPSSFHEPTGEAIGKEVQLLFCKPL